MDRHELEKWCYKAAREAVRESNAGTIVSVISVSNDPYRTFKAVKIAEGEVYKATLRHRLRVWKRERRLLPVRAYA